MLHCVAFSNHKIKVLQKSPVIITCNILFELHMLWFNFYFPLFHTHYHTLPRTKTKENKNCTKDKIEPQHIHYSSVPGDEFFPFPETSNQLNPGVLWIFYCMS